MGTFAFAMSGAFKAIRKKLDILGILVLGFATAMGGGALRDLLVLEIPMILHADFYATAALLGGLSFVLLSATGFQPSVVSAAVTRYLRPHWPSSAWTAHPAWALSLHCFAKIFRTWDT